MSFFNVCQDMKTHITPRNSHLARKYRHACKQQQPSIKNKKISLSHKNKPEPESRRKPLHNPKRSLKKVHSKNDNHSSMQSVTIYRKKQPEHKNILHPQYQLKNEKKRLQELTGKVSAISNSVKSLEIFYNYGLDMKQIKKQQHAKRFPTSSWNNKVKFNYMNPEDSYSQRNMTKSEDTKQKVNRHYQSHTNATTTTHHWQSDSKLETQFHLNGSINQMNPNSSSNHHNFGINNQKNKNLIFSNLQPGNRNEYFNQYMKGPIRCDENASGKQRLQLNQFSCIKAESIIGEDEDDRYSEVLNDSLVLKLKRYSSVAQIQYGLDDQHMFMWKSHQNKEDSSYISS